MNTHQYITDNKGNKLSIVLPMKEYVSTKDGKIVLTDAKSSATAGLTKNQKIGYPALEKNGGVVVGNKGTSSGYPSGTKIPPTKVEIERPKIRPMSVENIHVIDFVSIDKDGNAVLTVADDLKWDSEKCIF